MFLIFKYFSLQSSTFSKLFPNASKATLWLYLDGDGYHEIKCYRKLYDHTSYYQFQMLNEDDVSNSLVCILALLQRHFLMPVKLCCAIHWCCLGMLEDENELANHCMLNKFHTVKFELDSCFRFAFYTYSLCLMYKEVAFTAKGEILSRMRVKYSSRYIVLTRILKGVVFSHEKNTLSH